MSKRTIVSMPGDGIGKTVLPEAIRVLEAAGFEADYVHADIGWEFWCKEGNPLPQRTLDLLEKHKISLFGAITSKPKSDAAAELAPELRDKGFVYYSPIVGLRQHFDLDVCMRPCKTFKGNPLNFIRKGPNDTIEEPEVDVVIFRQNTEGLYGGVEWTNPPDDVYAALNTHPKFKKFAAVPKEELAISTRIFTKKATTRILRAAFEYAKKFGYKSVTVCEKPNVIRETSGMMLALARQMVKEYDGIALWDTNIDAQMMWLTKNPEDYTQALADKYNVCFYMIGDATDSRSKKRLADMAKANACSRVIPFKQFVDNPNYVTGALYVVKANERIVTTTETRITGLKVGDVLFDFNKADVQSQYGADMEALGNFLKKNPNAYALLVGYTDSIGSEEYNLVLSNRRADSVADHLVSNCGVTQDQIVVNWYGEANPVASNDTDEGRAQNRRVEVAVGGL